MNKTWFVTGAGRDLGVEIARKALAAGHSAVATGRNPDAVRTAMQALFVCLSQAALGFGTLAGEVVVDHAGTSGAMLFGGLASLTTLVLAMLHQRSRKVLAVSLSR